MLRDRTDAEHVVAVLLARPGTTMRRRTSRAGTGAALALGGAVLRAALLVVAPAVSTAMVAAGGGGLAGAGDIAAHLLHTIPEEKLQEVSQLLGSGESGLLIVAIDRRGIEISPLLEQAEKAAVIETKTGDLDAAFYGALEAAATTTGHAVPSRHARATGPIAGDAQLADWPAG